MAVRIRLKRLGRRHRPFFRICAMDSRSPRDGKAIEQLGYYDPLQKEKDARAILNGERIAYWLSVGAQPTEKVKTLIKKYGQGGTHLPQQKEALERLQKSRPAPAKAPGKQPADESSQGEQPDNAVEAAASSEQASSAADQ